MGPSAHRRILLALLIGAAAYASPASARGARVVTDPRIPPWRIQVLIYESVDFSYTDPLGQDRHIVTQMGPVELQRTIDAAQRFVQEDVPALTSGRMVPEWTIDVVEEPLTTLEAVFSCVWAPGGQGYWPGPSTTAPDRDPSYDSVFVVWKDWGQDLNTGETFYIGCAGGLTWPMGTGQTWASAKLQLISPTHENVFKHEWGHSILFYFAAAGVAPEPPVDNHIDVFDPQYVHCVSAARYAMEDGRLVEDDTVPNSAYHDESGFTHDYYSGTTALRADPTHCLGITPSAWAQGGPVTAPAEPANDDFGEALEIAGYPGQAVGSSEGATAEPGEPFPLAGSRSVWWQWTAPTWALAAFDTEGSDFDTVLAVYQGGSLDALELVAWNDDAGAGTFSEASFLAGPGQTYWIAVDGHEGAEGSVALHWNYTWESANPQCRDGIDNDGDGRIDFDGGIAAGLPAEEITEPDAYCARHWPGLVVWEEFPCGRGFDLALAAPALVGLGRWRRARRS